MKHIRQIIAEMTDDWKANAGVETPTADRAAIVAKMHAAGELAFLDVVAPAQAAPMAARNRAIREQIRRRT